MSPGGVWDPLELRLRRVRDQLHESRLDALLVSHLPNIRWLSGFTGSSAFLLVEPGSATLVTDFRYRTQVADELTVGISVSIADSDLFAAVARCLEDGGTGPRVGFEDHDLTIRDRRALGEACGAVMWEPAGAIVADLRSTKDADEVASISRAVGVAETALSEVEACISEGVSEADLAAELVYRLMRAGSESMPFEPIVASGPRSALPHAHPSERRLQRGDLVLLDFGARVDGYCSDMTRMFVLGPPAAWQLEIYAVVRDAVGRAATVAAAGVAARDVDHAARSVIAEAGFGDRFGHGTGHGVGIEVHEQPSVNARSRETLQAGNVVTIEPAVYLPGRGGVRLENMLVAVDGGANVLNQYPLDLKQV